MTPWKHAQSSVKKFGGSPADYIQIHNWFDETKQYTGDWTHRALRHHAAGVQWCVERFGHAVINSIGIEVPVKLIAEQHVEEDCGHVPLASHWLELLRTQPRDWMLRVAKTSKQVDMQIEGGHMSKSEQTLEGTAHG